MSVRRFARAAVDRLGLTGPWFRLYEWRESLRREKPPARGPDGMPVPPRYLMMLVAGTADWRWFITSGHAAAKAFAGYAGEAGCDIAKARRVLDFGCGCGRIIRHLSELTEAELHGVDYNPRLVEWCARNLPGAFSVNRLTPPLDAPDAHFDLVYLYSIFTHLRVETQRLWLEELARVAAPGAAVLVSFHDEDHPGLPAGDAARQALDRDGVYVHVGRIEGSNLTATFQTRDAVRSLVSQWFDVVRIAPSGETPMGQAMAILRRR